MTTVSLCVPLSLLWDMISLGVLLGFNLPNSALILVRAGCTGTHTGPNPRARHPLLMYCLASGLAPTARSTG